MIGRCVEPPDAASAQSAGLPGALAGFGFRVGGLVDHEPSISSSASSQRKESTATASSSNSCDPDVEVAVLEYLSEPRQAVVSRL
jgi:hypothetical protein